MNTIDKADVKSALLNAAREPMLRGLAEARQLARTGQTTELESVLSGLLDQARALETAEAADSLAQDRSETGPTSCASQLNAALIAKSAEPVSEFLLIPYGEIEVERPLSGGDFVFTQRHAASAKRWFDAIGRKLAIDYEHQSIDRLNTRADGLSPAAGWVGGLELRDDGLWATRVEWTPKAADLLRSGEYRYFSPVVYWTDEDLSDVAALGPVALTNDPAMHGVTALAASRSDDGEEIERYEASQELLEAQREIAVLQRQLQAVEADAFVERGMRLGKILDSTSMDWREDFLRDADAAESRLARSPILLPPGRVVQRDARGQVARLEPNQPSERLKRLGIDAEDLSAYEQAFAAGRVKHFNRGA